MSDKLTQAVLGFRMWPLTPQGLGAATSRPGWKPGVNRAKCEPPGGHPSGGFYIMDTRLRHPHSAPHVDCHCGLYAWGTLDVLREYRYNPGMSLYGAVAGWGKVISHEQGWRAQYARVLAFAMKDDTPFMRAIAELVADQYKVPLVPFGMLQLQGALHAQSVPDEHKPVPNYASEMDRLYMQYMYGTRYATPSSTAPIHNAYWSSAIVKEPKEGDIAKPAKSGDLLSELKKSTYRPPERRSQQWRNSR